MKRSLLVSVMLLAVISTTEARQATCIIAHAGDRSRKLVSFDLDDQKSPYITNVNGIDGDANGEPIVDIPLFSAANAEFQTWYYSDVKIDSDDTRSKVGLSFGVSPFQSREFVAYHRYTLYIDWKYGTAGWLDESMMYNLMGSLEKLPAQAAYPADCHRRD